MVSMSMFLNKEVARNLLKTSKRSIEDIALATELAIDEAVALKGIFIA